MLQIKTIAENNTQKFDETVNLAIELGWELVGRHYTPDGYFVAELEREVTVEEEEEPEADGTAEWLFSRRNPLEPYHCSACGHAADPVKPLQVVCPNCRKNMTWRTE